MKYKFLNMNTKKFNSYVTKIKKVVNSYDPLMEFEKGKKIDKDARKLNQVLKELPKYGFNLNLSFKMIDKYKYIDYLEGLQVSEQTNNHLYDYYESIIFNLQDYSGRYIKYLYNPKIINYGFYFERIKDLNFYEPTQELKGLDIIGLCKRLLYEINRGPALNRYGNFIA